MTGKASVVRKLPQVAAHPEYYAALDYSLELQTLKLGETDSPDAESRQTFELPLAGEDVVAIIEQVEGRRWSIEWNLAGDFPDTLVIEADHRGPEHGVDAWLGHSDTSGEPMPQYAIEQVEVIEGVTADA